VRRLRAMLAAAGALTAFVVPGQAEAAVLTLGPACIKTSEQVVHGDLYGAFNYFTPIDAGFAFAVYGPGGEYVDATYSDLTLDSNPSTGTGGYHFNIHLPAALPDGNYTVTAYGSRPPPEGDSKTLKIGSGCDSVLMGNVDFFDPTDGMSNVSGDVKRASPFVIFRSATVRKLGVYLDGGGGGISQRVRGVVYSNAQGKPAALVGQSFEFTVPGYMAPQWVELYMAPPVRIPPGVYWLGLQSAPPQKTFFGRPPVARFGWVSKPNSRRYNIDGYTDGPSAAFGDTLVDEQQMSIYASGSY
jgi:hypothetical protein